MSGCLSRPQDRTAWMSHGASSGSLRDQTSRLLEFDGAAQIVAAGLGAQLAANLAALRARVKNRPVARAELEPGVLDAIAAALKGAKFGVAVWTAACLDALEIEMLNGLVRDLNESTRFSTLPLAPPDNGLGVLEVCGWMTGFPVRTGFRSDGPIARSLALRR